MNDFEGESRIYYAEVEAEAARLVREGYAPYDALLRAGTIVRERRQRAAMNPARPTPHAEPHP